MSNPTATIQLRVLRPLHHSGRAWPAGAVLKLDPTAAAEALLSSRVELVNANDAAVVHEAGAAAAAATLRRLGVPAGPRPEAWVSRR